MAEDMKGRFIVAQRVADEPAMVFQPDGTFLTTIGRVGDGPGEYRSIQAISVAENAIHLYDEGTQRISIVDDEFNFQGSVPLRGAALWDGVALSTDLHAVNMLTFDGAATGYALHLVNGTGEIIRSMEPIDSRDGDPRAHFRHVFRDVDGDGFWSVPMLGRVILRRYSAAGDLLSEWLAVPSPGDESQEGNPDKDRPQTRQTLAAWHDDGLVWVVSMIPRKRTDTGLAVDGAVEVVDAASQRLLVAQHSEDVPVTNPIGPGVAARMTTDDLGWVYLHIRRARLVRSIPKEER